MLNSILNTIKKMLGIDADYEVYDEDITNHINASIFKLKDVGYPVPPGFIVEDDTQNWDDLLFSPEDDQVVKQFIYLETKCMFDPPQTGYTLDSFKKQIDELIWRLNTHEKEVI